MSKVDLCNEFNRSLKRLFLSADKYDKSVATRDSFIKLKNRLFMIIYEAPGSPITLIGPYLFKWRKSIQNNDYSFFTENDFTKERGPVLNPAITDVIKFVRKTFKQANKKDKEDVWEHIKNLLLVYAKYLKICKNEK